jgi:HAD superfamily phosphoserine phosphatase-like hydrolase
MHTHPEWLEPFSPEFRHAIARQLDEGGDGRLACFDADGTLWSEDIGEAFFRWLAAGSLLPPLAPERDPFDIYEEYEERVRHSRAAGFSWAVQCMAGLPEVDVRRWCRQMAVAWPNYRPAMTALIRGLTAAGYEVWIVSASNVWIVEATAPLVGIDPAHVIGIQVEVEAGRLTDRIVVPVIANEGKVQAIHKYIGRTPDLVVGDSLGDLEMLESARLPLVVGRRDKPGTEMTKLATQKGWPIHLF